MQCGEDKEWLTLLNDRSMGGGVIIPGELELMIQRRTTMDDGRGVEEPLDEHDEDGKGLGVVTTMRLVLEGSAHRTENGVAWPKIAQMSMQRVPIVAFSPTPLTEPTSPTDKSYSTTGTVIQLYPESHTSIIVRLENPNEVFYTESGQQEFDLDELAEHLYVSSNGGNSPASTSFEELSLTGNQSRAERDANKPVWKKEVPTKKVVKDNSQDSMDLVTLDHLEMRTFRVTYTHSPTDTGNLIKE